MLIHVYLFLLCSTSLSPWITITKPSHSAFVLKVRWTRTVPYGFSSSYATSAFDLIVRTLCLHLLTVKMNPSPVCIVRLNFPFPSRSQLCLKVHPFGNLLFLFPSSFFEFLLLCFSFPVGDPRSQGIIVSCTIDYMSYREERLRAPFLRLWAFVFVHAHIFAQVVLNSRVLSFHCSVVVPHCWVSSFFFLFGIVGFISEDNMKPPQSILKKIQNQQWPAYSRPAVTVLSLSLLLHLYPPAQAEFSLFSYILWGGVARDSEKGSENWVLHTNHIDFF